MSSRQRKDLKLRKIFKQFPCLVCGIVPSDPCHIRTFKVTQSDNPKNIIPMCRAHHQEQHRIGWKAFLEKYEKVKKFLLRMGWEIIPKVGGGVIMSHSEIK
jgi:hypothetical protein